LDDIGFRYGEYQAFYWQRLLLLKWEFNGGESRKQNSGVILLAILTFSYGYLLYPWGAQAWHYSGMSIMACQYGTWSG
jgi:hypothetical protein